MALQKGQRLREVGQFEVAEVGQIKSAGDIAALPGSLLIRPGFRRHSRPSLRVAPFKLYRGQVAS
ncbi:hypothetical protein XcvCFBP7113P_22450 [Xanthomonas citri pv. vignicola]|nr:hypothetical protein XcvCFBP7113P_22450 [Xanthomonas citri pv. vignicola]